MSQCSFLMKEKRKLSRFSWPRVSRHRRWFSAILSRSSVCFPSLCRATHQETTVKPCWCSAEGKINLVTSLQLLLQTSVRNHETTAHTLKLRDLTSVSIVTAVCPKPNQAKCSLTPTRRPFKTLFVCFHVCFVSFDFLFFYDKCYLKMNVERRLVCHRWWAMSRCKTAFTLQAIQCSLWFSVVLCTWIKRSKNKCLYESQVFTISLMTSAARLVVTHTAIQPI